MFCSFFIDLNCTSRYNYIIISLFSSNICPKFFTAFFTNSRTSKGIIGKFILFNRFNFAFANRTKQYRSLVEGYYKIIYTMRNDHTIQVVLLWDCRQNPDKLKKL